MVEQRRIEKAAGRCVKSGAAIAEGETYYAALYEDGEGFRREDFSVAAWEGPPEGAYCFFKTRMPVKEKKKRFLVDDDTLMSFFTRLANETQAVRVQFRFVLALLLMRKRLLKYDRTEREDNQEQWLMRVPKTGETHTVVNPHLTDAEIEGVSRELTVILHGDVEGLDDERPEEIDD